jgi:hypothetical protein
VGKLLLIGVGAVAGVLGVRRASRLVRAASPRGAEGWGTSLREFADDVRAGMAEREEQLRIALGVDAGTIDEATARELLENPTSPRRAARG